VITMRKNNGFFAICCCAECSFFVRKSNFCTQRNINTEECDCGPLNYDCNPKMTFINKLSTIYHRLRFVLFDAKYDNKYQCDNCKNVLYFAYRNGVFYEAEGEKCTACQKGVYHLVRAAKVRKNA
jgi:hypothetical protein